MNQNSQEQVLLNSNKFSLAQATANSATGKTSGSGTIGVLWGFIIGISFLLGVIDKMWVSKTTDIISYTLAFAAIDAGLLGLRKAKDSKGEIASINPDENVETNS